MIRTYALPLLIIAAVRTLAGCALADGLAGEDEMRVLATPSLAADPEALDFGEVTVGSERVLEARLTNTGSLPVSVDTASVVSPFFGPVLAGTTLRPGETIVVAPGFRPIGAGEATGKFVVRVVGGRTLTIGLRGTGNGLPEPRWSVAPPSLDFGFVNALETSRRTITIANLGTASGRITHLTLGSTGREATSGDTFGLEDALPLVIPAGSEISVTALFRPTGGGARGDYLLFVPDAGEAFRVDVRGSTGAQPLGTLECAPTRLSFGTLSRGHSATLQSECTARGGPLRIFGATFTSSTSSFSLARAVGTIDLHEGERTEVAVIFSAGGLAGVRTATLAISYSAEVMRRELRISLSGLVEPPPRTDTAIALELRWNTNFTDLDLHLTRPNSIPFSPIGGDCYYQNPAPDWGRPGDTTDDPYLDRDDTQGPGPELLTLVETSSGAYDVYVHYFSDHQNGPSTATVDVYVSGNLAGSFLRQLMCDDVWTVGTIRWFGTHGIFVPSSVVQANSGQGVCGL